MNDIFETTEAATKIAGNLLHNTIDAAVQKRIKWQNGTYAAANAELYNVLADCLDLFTAVRRSYELPKGVNALLEDRGLKGNASTSLELKIVRLVFADEHTTTQAQNRLFGYARVIRAAADAKQTGATLAKFIADNHGIDEIRRVSKTGINSVQKLKSEIEQARAELITPSDTELYSSFDLLDALQPKDGEHFSLALVRKNADGTGSIVFGTNNVAAVTSVLAIAGKTLKADAIKALELTAEQCAEETRNKNLAALQSTIAATFTPQFKLSRKQTQFA